MHRQGLGFSVSADTESSRAGRESSLENASDDCCELHDEEANFDEEKYMGDSLDVEHPSPKRIRLM